MEYHFELFADFHQFYLQDDDGRYGDLSKAWDEAAVERGLAVAPHVVGVSTARNADVPVIVRICDGRPDIDKANFDRVSECTIDINTGRIVVAGCSDHFPEAARIETAPGCYAVLVGYKGLETLSEDGLAGEDSYHIFLWRG